jgi:hypothetical protein
MTYSKAIAVLNTIYSMLPNNYVLKGAFAQSIENLEGGGSDADLQICDQVFDAYPTPNFQTALNVISDTVNPDKRYPTKPIY